MSFSFRDKGRLSDRLRGKTCDEILKELRDHLHQDRSMSFDSSPSWGGFSSGPAFSRAGFPFMDQDMMQRPDMRAHFEDLASRHPEFADHLRPAAWGTVPEAETHFFQPTSPGPDLYRQRHASGSSSSGSGVYSEDCSIPIPVIHEDSGGGSGGSSRSRTRKIPQYGLRNTVDLGESQKVNPTDTADGEARSQRSWSAPPDNRAQGEAPQPKRFVTRVDINNSQGNPSTSGANDSSTPNSTSGVSSPGKPPPFPKSSGGSSPQTQQPTSKTSTVRHIPIFVEGRDEPVLPKPKESHSFASSHSSSGFGQPNFSYSYAQAPPGTHSTAFASSHASSSPPGQNRSQPNPPQAHKPQPHASAPQEQKQNVPPKQPQAPKPIPRDPIAKVQAIQEEVNELRGFVDKFSGARNDKEYIYLDEMLTRNLIKLDDIETDGKENIRLARKEAIRSIQKCISILESKAPLPQDTSVEAAEEGQQTSSMDDESQSENSKEQVPEPSANLDETAKGVTKPSDSMEVDNNNCSGQTNSSGADNIATENSDPGSQTEKPMDIAQDGATDDKTHSDQDLERMEEQPVLEVVSQTLEDGQLPVDADTTNTTHEAVVNKTEPVPSTDSTSETAGTENEANSNVIGDAAVVREEAKPTNGVENTSGEVAVSKSETTNPQNSSSTSDASVEKCEVDSQENVNPAVTSVMPTNEDAEKAVSS